MCTAELCKHPYRYLNFLCMYHIILIRPLINGKHEEKDCGDGPKLEIIFEDDTHLKELEQDTIVSIIRCWPTINVASIPAMHMHGN